MDRSIKSRDELKSFFSKGTVPKEEHFAALIDSVVIFEDDPLLASDERMKPYFEEINNGADSTDDESVVNAEAETYTIPADGEWHSLQLATSGEANLPGCHIYMLYASLYNKRSGNYAMCSAVASHCDGDERKISSLKKHWWGWSGKIKLRWKKSGGKLYLQMRTKGNMNGVEHIYYRISEEWSFVKK